MDQIQKAPDLLSEIKLVVDENRSPGQYVVTGSSDYTLYQYRDIDQREIDFLIENDVGDLAGIEVKAGSGVGKDDFKHLVWFRDHLAKSRHFVGIVLYSGAQVLSFGNGMLAVPISSLWSE